MGEDGRPDFELSLSGCRGPGARGQHYVFPISEQDSRLHPLEIDFLMADLQSRAVCIAGTLR